MNRKSTIASCPTDGDQSAIAHSMRTVWSLADQGLVSGTRFATTWIIARFCGAEELGFYALGFTLLVLLDLTQQAFVSAPYTVLVQRTLARDQARYAGVATSFAFLIGLLGLFVFLFAGIFISLNSETQLGSVMFALAAAASLCVVREFARRYCFAHGRFPLAFAIDATWGFLQISTLLVLVGQGTLNATWAHACMGLGSAVAIGIWLAKTSRQFWLAPGEREWQRHAKRHWRFGRWVFATQAANQLSWNLVQWIVAVYLSTQATGVYAGCLTLVFLSNPLVLGIANILYPRLASEYSPSNPAKMTLVARRASLAIASVMSLFTLGAMLAGQTLCDLLYDDPAYVGVTSLITYLAVAISSLAITMPFDGCLWAQERTDLSSFCSGIGMLVSCLFVVVLVQYGLAWTAFGLMVGCVVESLARLILFEWTLRQVPHKTAATAS